MGESTSISSTATSTNNYNVRLLWSKMILKDRACYEGFICCLPLRSLVRFFNGSQHRGGEKNLSKARDSVLVPTVSLSWE